MGSKTNLRALRYRHHITFAQLASCAGLSGQYISRVELGEITATSRLEVQMSAALEAVISKRRAELQEAQCRRHHPAAERGGGHRPAVSGRL